VSVKGSDKEIEKEEKKWKRGKEGQNKSKTHTTVFPVFSAVTLKNFNKYKIYQKGRS